MNNKVKSELMKTIKTSFIFLIIIGCQKSHKKPQLKEYSYSVESSSDSLDSALTMIIEENPIVGFGAAIVSPDSVFLQKGYGSSHLESDHRYTAQSIQPIASISKTFIGVSIMILVDQGKLSLDEPINDILPYDIYNPHFPEELITVRHLVTHTSTITDDFEDEDDSVFWLLENWKFPSQAFRPFTKRAL